MEAKRQDILRRVGLLYTLAEQPGTPHEAVAAMAAIQRLQTKFNLTPEELDKSKYGSASRFEVYKLILDVGRGTNYVWMQSLATTLCNTNFSKAICFNDRTIHVIGPSSALTYIVEMFTYLTKTLERMATDDWKEFLIRNRGSREAASAVRWKRKYLTGAVSTLHYRLEKLVEETMKEEEEQRPGTSAMVLVRDNDLAEFVEDKYGKLVSRNKKEEIDAAFLLGQFAGMNVNLDRQLGE